LLMHARGRSAIARSPRRNGACIMNVNPQETLFAKSISTNPQKLFSADWHPQLGQRLAVFPRSIQLELPGLKAGFSPHLPTFIEDDGRRLLMYYAQGTPWSLLAAYDKGASELHTSLYWEGDVVISGGAA